MASRISRAGSIIYSLAVHRLPQDYRSSHVSLPIKETKKLRELVGLEKLREGGGHQVWKTTAGNLVEIPWHAKDLGRGLLRSILRQQA
ncbi:MAG: type II toxin-antitoxin system HicA family toxin [Verrucomicrobia bacterium]|nr:type II toxin-antitoxin system HicA family toxin [Verrucomicrobiota bacterium]